MITDQDEPNQYGLDVSCNLGSIDIHAASKVKDFEKLVDTAMRLLTNVSQMTDIKNVPSVAKANQINAFCRAWCDEFTWTSCDAGNPVRFKGID